MFVLLHSLLGGKWMLKMATGSFGRGARHRSAKPATPVQIRKRPPTKKRNSELEFLFLSLVQFDYEVLGLWDQSVEEAVGESCDVMA